MRTLLAVLILVGSTCALQGPADAAARKANRSAKTQYQTARPQSPREQAECERARHRDPAGQLAGYPCWAREALSPNDAAGQ
jgi:hypothetical protein